MHMRVVPQANPLLPDKYTMGYSGEVYKMIMSKEKLFKVFANAPAFQAAAENRIYELMSGVSGKYHIVPCKAVPPNLDQRSIVEFCVAHAHGKRLIEFKNAAIMATP